MPRAALLLALLVLPACSEADTGETTASAATATGSTSAEPTTSATTSTSSTGDTTGAPDESSVWDTPYCHPVKDGPAWPAPFPAWEEQVLVLVNEARAVGHDCDSKGDFGPTTPLTLNASLRCAARKHAADMATRDFFDHINPSGETFVDRILMAGYGSYAEIGENIAGGLDIDDPRVAVDGWLASDGHCANIMNPLYTEFGAGAYEGGGALTFYWTQEFGRPN
jgi:uncharacterized protein YkwD